MSFLILSSLFLMFSKRIRFFSEIRWSLPKFSSTRCRSATKFTISRLLLSCTYSSRANCFMHDCYTLLFTLHSIWFSSSLCLLAIFSSRKFRYSVISTPKKYFYFSDICFKADFRASISLVLQLSAKYKI